MGLRLLGPGLCAPPALVSDRQTARSRFDPGFPMTRAKNKIISCLFSPSISPLLLFSLLCLSSYVVQSAKRDHTSCVKQTCQPSRHHLRHISPSSTPKTPASREISGIPTPFVVNKMSWGPPGPEARMG